MPTRSHRFPSQRHRNCGRMRRLPGLFAVALFVAPISAQAAADATARMPAGVASGSAHAAAEAAAAMLQIGSGWPQPSDPARVAALNGRGAALKGAVSENSVAPQSGPWPAPTGHRQPQIQDLPADVRHEEGEVTRSERELDKLIGSICRGC